MDDQMAEERFARLRTIVKMFADEGIQALHENCMNYGGQGWQYTLRMLDEVPGLKLVFDTGNPVNTEDRENPGHRQRGDYEEARGKKMFLAFVHVDAQSVFSARSRRRTSAMLIRKIGYPE